MELIRNSKMFVVASVLALVLLTSASSFAGVFVSVGFGPPALPVYVQPPCPAAGYIWTPGYWAYGPNGYFWVPGTWVVAPEAGLLWTPGYWGWGGAAFIWHGGYWGPHVGFYGGINYGFGYTGVGYGGGYWHNGAFFYNRSVNNVTSIHVTNVYNRTVINNTTVNRVSFNGGQGGIVARATPAEEAIARQKHFAPTSLQARQETTAASNRQLWASENHGRPAIAATARPGVFKGNGVVAAREAGAPYRAPEHAAAQPRANNVVPRPANNAVARPANNVARPATSERAATPARNNVPRPPENSARSNSPRIENTARPAGRPQMSGNQVPRPNVATRNAAPRSNPAPRSENASRPQMESRSAPRTAERPANEPRQEGHGKGR